MKITDLQYIKEITELLKASKLNRIEIKDGENSIHIERYEQAYPAYPPIMPVAGGGADLPTAAAPAPLQEDAGILVKSPIVGVFYSSNSPDAPPFVKVGDAVKKGDVLCVIEAMKFFNEITAEEDGTVVEVCLKNGDVVEFGQTLFKLA
ncbi:MAG: acetyl-CoA carboxylase biotin carboxyl carrier protein [Oscillospiraceae bacterium]|nr:acetyl-CoA carboxylase biotin carboxyl carrier protein [Oscillospiraceae bacterium]